MAPAPQPWNNEHVIRDALDSQNFAMIGDIDVLIPVLVDGRELHVRKWGHTHEFIL